VEEIKILLISDQELIRRGVRSLLEQEEDMEVISDYASVEEASFQIARLVPDIVILDNQLPGTGLAEAIKNIKRSRPGSNIDVIVLAESTQHSEAFFNAGADDFLLKNMTGTEFRKTIRQVYQNSYHLNHLDKGPEEIVELIIPPPVNAPALFRFISQLGQLLQGRFESILCTTGSWDKGTIIVIRANTRMPASLAIELANMAEVEKVEEAPALNSVASGSGDKFELLPRLGINPSRKLQLALK